MHCSVRLLTASSWARPPHRRAPRPNSLDTLTSCPLRDRASRRCPRTAPPREHGRRCRGSWGYRAQGGRNCVLGGGGGPVVSRVETVTAETKLDSRVTWSRPVVRVRVRERVGRRARRGVGVAVGDLAPTAAMSVAFGFFSCVAASNNNQMQRRECHPSQHAHHTLHTSNPDGSRYNIGEGATHAPRPRTLRRQRPLTALGGAPTQRWRKTWPGTH